MFPSLVSVVNLIWSSALLTFTIAQTITIETVNEKHSSVINRFPKPLISAWKNGKEYSHCFSGSDRLMHVNLVCFHVYLLSTFSSCWASEQANDTWRPNTTFSFNQIRRRRSQASNLRPSRKPSPRRLILIPIILSHVRVRWIVIIELSDCRTSS